jgi:two-component system NtrC family response regulator
MFNDQYKKKMRRFSLSALTFLKSHDWPGNVRELRNRVQRAVIMSDGSVIELEDLGSDEDMPAQVRLSQPVTTLREAREKVERELIAVAIERQNGNMVKAAEELGVSRPTLYDLMKKHALTPLTPTDKAPEPVP